MDFKWYVVHTYSGFENKVKLSLMENIVKADKQSCFGEILVPEEEVVSLVKGQRRTSKRKFFPGYIIVNMVLTDETWHIVRNTPKITGFVGTKDKPTPIPNSEVEHLCGRISEGTLVPKSKFSYEVGDVVKIIDGPFAGFDGSVDEVKPEKGKLRVTVSIFGRATPVEIDFIQVSSEV
ncbi:MAG: transcription termination/antitermination protein NusG [Deltaproteobacteria bacterium]|nr:transcription termination/antitermination protein NusG [Deltaproteobacteria bacterium]